MDAITIRPKGGHRIYNDGGRVYLTDDSDETVEVDRSRNITYNGRCFDIPVLPGNAFTSAGAEEAFLVAQFTKRPIAAGARRFEIRQVWHNGWCVE